MIHFLIVLCLVAGIAGLVTSTVFAMLAVLSAFEFTFRKQDQSGGDFLPPLSLLKPLSGAEPGLEKHLRTFFEQDYPEFEILFCARDGRDPALEVARRVARAFPQVPVSFLSSGEPPYPTAKVWSLERMQRKASHDFLVVSDSDVSVTRNYLRSVVAPFRDKRVGLVTCLYRGVSGSGSSGGSLWSRLEAAGMSFEMTAGVLVAWMLEGMKFALGPTMVVRLSAVRSFGGFRSLGQYHADDFMLGNLVSAAGYRVLLSRHVVTHHVLNEGMASSVRHQIRWMRSTRFSRPKGHLGTALTFSMPYALLAAAAALASRHTGLAVELLAWGWFTRIGLAACISGVLGGSPSRAPSLRPTVFEAILLYPLRDLLGSFCWAASYLSREVRWRGNAYRLLEHGLMLRCHEPASTASVPASLSHTPEDPELATAD